MQYKKISIKTTTDAAEIVGGILLSNDISSWEVVDSLPVYDPYAPKLYPELQPDSKDNEICFINIFVNTDEYDKKFIEKIINDIRAIDYVDTGSLEVNVETIDESNWRDKWKEYFHSFEIDNVLIVPTWEEPPVDLGGKILVRIDPGISFGTGSHESTRLCIRGLLKYLKKDMKVLDVGFGSGILSIVSLKLGAKEVCAVDIDPDCMISAKDNLYKNELDERLVDLKIGDLSNDIKLADSIVDNKYDVLVTNILADIIIELLPVIVKKIKPGGMIIASGIIDFKMKNIIDAFLDVGLTVTETSEDGEWRMVAAIREES